MLPIEKQVDYFLSHNLRSQWLRANNIKVYLRKSVRLVEGEIYNNCIDLANIEVEIENRGTCTKFIEYLETKGKHIYVENILSPSLLHIVTKRNYLVFDLGFMPQAFKKIDTKEK